MKWVKLFENFDTNTKNVYDKLIELNILDNETSFISDDKIEVYALKNQQFNYFLDNQIHIFTDKDGDKIILNIEYIDMNDEDEDDRNEVIKYIDNIFNQVLYKHNMIVYSDYDEIFENFEKEPINGAYDQTYKYYWVRHKTQFPSDPQAYGMEPAEDKPSNYNIARVEINDDPENNDPENDLSWEIIASDNILSKREIDEGFDIISEIPTPW